jgi:AraC family transcriptional regulator of adaptative response/methylated-DNA-[protein]-cysteine methyltransferase
MAAEANRYAKDEARWQAVMQRDRGADGQFCYSVRTTGVYCRPSCPSRLAKRANVRFHADWAQAEQAGFRPCRRCRPKDVTLEQCLRDTVTRACRLIEQANESPCLSDLAAAVGMSTFHFHRVFKQFTGVTPKKYAAAIRTQRVHEELTKRASVTEAIYRAGFPSSGRFYATATEQLGMTPTRYRDGGIGVTIRFAVGECSLGSILVAATDQGVCAIFLGDDPDALARDLQDRFASAHFVGGDAALDRWVALAIGLIEQPKHDIDLPLDIRGTAFQQRVWEALRQIPPGFTATYTEIAERIGRPTAARAVAQACAANPIAVAIPCHRVIRTDQSLSGYRWGVERKAVLLHRERENPPV